MYAISFRRFFWFLTLVLPLVLPITFTFATPWLPPVVSEGELPEHLPLPPLPIDQQTAFCLGHRASGLSQPQLAIEPYVRPEFARQMVALRPVLLEAAARHNRPELSHMSHRDFAVVLALLLYNEHNGWLEDAIEPLRWFTPVYQYAQVLSNQSGVGSNFSVWPTNLRPSVALEITFQQVPLPGPTGMLTVPITVEGSHIVPSEYPSQQALFAALTREIRQDELAVEYLAANLERGLYRAHYEGVPVNWRVLAAWHNQGIVRPEQIRANANAQDYVRRASAYLPTARSLIEQGK
ncbi:MAG: hypothetical protein HC884_17250 [Chloroflexaceae bacterium]|nr:hypothetical protein [Chloroflexaceae bacterium]